MGCARRTRTPGDLCIHQTLYLLFSRSMYSFTQHVVHVLFIIYTGKKRRFFDKLSKFKVSYYNLIYLHHSVNLTDYSRYNLRIYNIFTVAYLLTHPFPSLCPFPPPRSSRVVAFICVMPKYIF